METQDLDFWLVIGFLGQLLFFLRFFVQWVVSEIKKRSTIPKAFWFLSILGGTTLLIYAIHRRDPVFILGQAGGLVIYVRNIMLLSRKQEDSI